MATNVPALTFTATGPVAPSSAAVLAGVNADLNAAFGGQLNPSPATPQGQLATSLTALLGLVNSYFLQYVNLVDPAFSSGRMQDALGRIYFLQRIGAAPTVVQALCTGAAGVVIPVGALAQDINGNQYVCTQAGTIPSGGSITLSFAAVLSGPTVCNAGALSIIYQAIPGWNSITNVAAGVLGNNTETSSAFEIRRQQSVAQNALGTLGAIKGAVLSVPGVLDAYVVDNPSNVAVTTGGVSISANSVYVCVLGGAASAIAYAIWTRKPPGCVYTGNTYVTVQDTSAGYVAPYPSYSVAFQTPSNLQTAMKVVIAASPQVPANAAALIQNAIISAYAGGDGLPRAKIGTILFASRYYTTVTALGSWAQIVSLQVGSTNAPGAVVYGSIAASVLTVSSTSSGAVAAGQFLFDAGGAIVSGTQIINQLTGTTGGVGTYTISNSQSVSSETITCVAANLFEVSVNINQVPVISAANIAVSTL